MDRFSISVRRCIKRNSRRWSPYCGSSHPCNIFRYADCCHDYGNPECSHQSMEALRYKAHITSKKFVIQFAVSGAIGAGTGTALLLSVRDAPLLLGLSGVIYLFLIFRIQQPQWQLSNTAAKILVIPCGLVGGTLQGAAGLSAPVSVTFLNLLKLERERFIPIISIYFVCMSLVQIPSLYAVKLLDTGIILYSFLVLPLIFAGMAIGSLTAQHINSKIFENIILGTLLIMALRLTYRAITGS